MHIDKLDDIVNEYDNSYHKKIKMKPIDGKSSSNFDFGVENNGKNPKLEVGDHVKISKYKSIFRKRLNSNLVWRTFCG